MSLFNDNVAVLSEMGPRRRLRGDTGRLDENGQVNPNPTIGLDTGYIWVRLRGERAAIAVLNLSVTTQRANIPVILEELDSGQLQVLQVEPEPAIFTYGAFAPALNMPDKPAEQEKSPVLHKRIKDLRLRLSSTGGLVLYLEPGLYRKVDGTLENWDGGTIDLTASVPGTIDQKRIVLVGLDSSNAIVQSAATAVDQITDPTTEFYFTREQIVTAVNAATATTTWLWSTPLLYGQTTINNTDGFTDLRPIVHAKGTLPIAQGGTGQTTATAAFNALSPLTTKGDLLGNDNTNDVRLAVGSTNGMQLIVDSTAASGLAWTAVGNVFQATLQTANNTVTTLISYAVAQLVGVTISGRIVASKSDKTAAYGASFRVTLRRATGGNVTLVGTGYIEAEEDSAGTPAVTFAVDTGTQVGLIQWQGISAETWDVKAWYTVVTV